jgi:two-component system phosphate regulon sensor histidine kinase PhoR
LLTLIDKVVSLYQPSMLQKQIELRYAPPLQLPMVLANESTIEQVLTNLLDNASTYTPMGGMITVAVVQRDNQTVQINVSDTGIGIEAKHIPRLFERFYRVDKARSRDLGGTGLGLSIVKHIIQLHGGDVWVTSTPGQGSTFSFTLRTSDDSAA